MSLEAKDAGHALGSIATTLLTYDVIEQEGYSVLTRLAGSLKRGKSSVDWSTEVDPGDPIVFKKVSGICDEEVVPKIVANIDVCQSDDTQEPPFTRLDIALTFWNTKGNPLSRWHIDRANPQGDGYQSGPLMHMQYGGHEPNFKEKFTKVSVPRWCHPPMDIALLCEIVAANVYEEKWLEFRDDPSWCRSLSEFERLCWTRYFESKMAHVGVSSTTALNRMWANSATAGAS